MKTEKQKISQLLLLLRILAKDDKIWGNLKLQKQVFLNELKLVNSGMGGLYYKYFRYQLGPYSADLATNFQWITNLSLAHKTSYKLTDRGRYLVEFVDGTLRDYQNNAKIFDAVDKTTEKYTAYTGQQLMNMVYKMTIEPEDMPGKNVMIRDIPICTDILSPEHHQFKIELSFPQQILKDIKTEIAFDDERKMKSQKHLPRLLKESEKQLRDSLDG